MERSKLTLEDMTSLLDIDNAIHKIEELLGVFVGCSDFDSESILGHLYKIETVIAHASPLYHPEEEGVEDDFSETEYGRIFEDETLSCEEKARRLLGETSVDHDIK